MIALSGSNTTPTTARCGIFWPPQQQNQQLYAVTDFKVKDVDVELGAGYGFTPGSDRLIFKAILGYAFPVSGSAASSDDRPAAGPVNPMSHTSLRSQQGGIFTPQ